mmetsp:Transcript_53285/g.142591  ORF Transcript_53285/g.142591 Transcript_53285/m.142591 type:complete len:212 (-) Transcript_53285:782-1417(-)
MGVKSHAGSTMSVKKLTKYGCLLPQRSPAEGHRSCGHVQRIVHTLGSQRIARVLWAGHRRQVLYVCHGNAEVVYAHGVQSKVVPEGRRRLLRHALPDFLLDHPDEVIPIFGPWKLSQSLELLHPLVELPIDQHQGHPVGHKRHDADGQMCGVGANLAKLLHREGVLSRNVWPRGTALVIHGPLRNDQPLSCLSQGGHEDLVGTRHRWAGQS